MEKTYQVRKIIASVDSQRKKDALTLTLKKTSTYKKKLKLRRTKNKKNIFLIFSLKRSNKQMGSIHSYQFIPLSFKIALSVQNQLNDIQEEKSAVQKVTIYTKLAVGAIVGVVESIFFFNMKYLAKELCKQTRNNPLILKFQYESESGFRRSQEIFAMIKKNCTGCIFSASLEETKTEIDSTPKRHAPVVPQSLFEIDPIEEKNQYKDLISSICEIAVQRTFHYAPEFIKSSIDEDQEEHSPQYQGRNNITGITPAALRGVAMYAQLIEIMQITSNRSIYQNVDWQRKNLIMKASANLQQLNMHEIQILLTKLLLGDEADSLVETDCSNSKLIIEELHRQIGQLSHTFISPNSNADIYQAFIHGYQQGLTLIPNEEE